MFRHIAFAGALSLSTLTLGGCKGSSPPAESLAVGAPAPDFDVVAVGGKRFHLAEERGHPVVLYFYLKNETPGCTKEACAFRDAWSALSEKGVVVIGVSTDTEASHRAFAEHHKLPFHLVSDPDEKLAKTFGVPSMAGFLKRQTILIDQAGNIKKVYRDVDVSHHADDVRRDVM